MKRRYVVCFDSLDVNQSKSITTLLKEKQLGWWHWIDNVWFITDSSGRFSASKIRDLLKPVAPNDRMVVLEINEQDDTWAGVRANDPENKMFTWFKETWNKNK